MLAVIFMTCEDLTVILTGASVGSVRCGAGTDFSIGMMTLLVGICVVALDIVIRVLIAWARVLPLLVAQVLIFGTMAMARNCGNVGYNRLAKHQ
jgi:hypothetical protein